MSDASNNSGDAANLGSAYAEVGWTYNRRGFEQFLRDTREAEQRQQQVSRARGQVSVQQTAAQITRIQQTQIQAEARLGAAQQQRIARTTAAELAANARVEAVRIASETRIRLDQERAARQAARSNVALPRTFAGFTRAGAVQAAGALGIAATADAAISKLVQLSQESALLAERAESIGVAYARTTEQAGVAADELLDKLKEVSRGTITEASLQQNAIRAIQLGVGRNAQEIADLLAIARVRARDFGITTEEAFERIVLGVGKAEPELLDEIGLLIDANRVYKDYATAIGVSSDELTKQQKVTAITNDLLRTNKERILEAADAELTAAEKRAQARARVEESKTRFGTATAPITAGALEETAGVAEVATGQPLLGLLEQNAALLETARTYEEYSDRLQQANTESRESMGFLAQAARTLLETFTPFGSRLFTVEPFTEEQYELARAMIANGESAERAAERIRDFAGVLLILERASGEGGDSVLRDMTEDLVRIAAASPDAQAAVERMVGEYMAGQRSAEELQRGIRDLSNEIGRAAEEKERAAALARIYGNELEGAAEKSEALEKAQESLSDAIIRAGNDLEQAQERRAESLADAAASYEERIAELNARSVEIAEDAQDAITEASQDAADARIELAEDEAEQIADAQRDAARERVRVEQETAREIADIREESTARRADLIQEQAEREQRIADERRRDEISAERDYNEQLLNIRKSYTERVFDLFRGRRGSREQRNQALEQLKQAEVEASEIAKTDAQAAAEFLQARQRQILEAIERQRETAQQARDAQRGDPGFSRADAADEAATEQAVIDAANEAEIAGIRARADERAAARAREDQDRAESNAEALAAIDEQEQAAIERVRESAAEQYAAIDEQERAAVARIQEATAEQRAAIDERQRERVQQIRDNATEQQREIDAQLITETESYKRQRDEIEADYQQFLADLQETLKAEANKLKYTPDEQKRQEERAAFEALATEYGQSFTAKLQEAINARAILIPPFIQTGGQTNYGVVPENVGTAGGTAPRSRTYGRGSVVEAKGDRVLSDQALDQVVVGGKQTGSYNGTRAGKLHEGVDIATPLNTPVKSPVDGIVTAVGETAIGGNYAIVTAANGDQWYFGHLNRATVSQGARVKRGQTIALSGATGTAVTGPHVHLQVKRANRTIDPTASLEQIASTPVTQTTTTTPTSATGSPGAGRQAQTVSGGAAIGAGPGDAINVWNTLPLPGGAAAGMGAPVFNITVNGGNGSPQDIAAAVRIEGINLIREYQQMREAALLHQAAQGTRRGV